MTSSRAGPSCGPPGSRKLLVATRLRRPGPYRPAAGRKDKIARPAVNTPASGRVPQVSLEGTTLTISGEGRSEREEKGEGRRFGEVRCGRFERSLTVPDGIDPEKVTARYENGVLEVTLPLPAGHAPRRVPIQLESHGSKKAVRSAPGRSASRSDRPSGARTRPLAGVEWRRGSRPLSPRLRGGRAALQRGRLLRRPRGLRGAPGLGRGQRLLALPGGAHPGRRRVSQVGLGACRRGAHARPGGRQACPPSGRLSPRRRRSAPPPGGRRRGDPRARGLARLPADGVTPAHRDDPRAGAPGWLTLPQGTGPGSPISVGGPRVLPHCAPPPTSTRLSL